MKKIMFNDRYGLTDAVLEGRKTMTRRIIRNLSNFDPRQDWMEWGNDDKGKANIAIFHNETYKYCVYPQYQPGEVVAVAQKYIDLKDCDAFYEALHKADPYMPLECIKDEKGAYNKMFVKAVWMPHQIQITNIKVERLQDISDEDCIKEGVTYNSTYWIMGYQVENLWNKYDRQSHFRSARVAFAALIDKISGKGTWNSNPYVFAYTFELIK